MAGVVPVDGAGVVLARQMPVWSRGGHLALEEGGLTCPIANNSPPPPTHTHTSDSGRGKMTAELLQPDEIAAGVLTQMGAEPRLRSVLATLIGSSSGNGTEVFLRSPGW